MAPEDASSPDRRVSRASLPLRVANPNPVQPWYRRIGFVAGWLMRRVARQDWDDAGHLPRTGGVLVVANHISNADPVVLAHYLIWNGRWPRFLAKAQLWTIPVVAQFVTAIGQIPVARGSKDAAQSLAAATAALRRGECVLVYPEGTITTDPQAWPMTGHPGAARLALMTGVPVIPIAQWGARRLLGGKRPSWPRLIPKPTMVVRTGPPIDLADLAGREDPEAVQEATRRIMATLTAMVAQLRGETAPLERFDPRLGTRVPDGPAGP